MSNFKSMLTRIRACKTPADIAKMEKSLERLYTVGVFNASELSRLDGLIFDQACAISEDDELIKAAGLKL